MVFAKIKIATKTKIKKAFVLKSIPEAILNIALII